MYSNSDDYELIEKFCAGDERAFNLIVARYQSRIYWHARRMLGNHDDADEIVQEVLLVMYNKLMSFNFKSALYTWIYKITSTRSLNLIKKNNLRKIISLEKVSNKENSTYSDIIVNLEQKEKYEKFEKYLQKLPVKQREVFILRNLDDLSYDEISEVTGKRTGTLKANYFHALKKMKEFMDKDE